MTCCPPEMAKEPAPFGPTAITPLVAKNEPPLMLTELVVASELVTRVMFESTLTVVLELIWRLPRPPLRLPRVSEDTDRLAPLLTVAIPVPEPRLTVPLLPMPRFAATKVPLERVRVPTRLEPEPRVSVPSWAKPEFTEIVAGKL